MIKSIILSTIYVMNYVGVTKSTNYVHPCSRYIDHLSLETKINIAMGCSKVQGRNLYNIKYLEELTEGLYE